MLKNVNRGSMPLRSAVASVLGFAVSMSAQAQQAPPVSSPPSELSEIVVVTGSYIRGTPEDAALPVDVLSSEDLEAQGAPTVVQLVKTITASGSAVGESNRYAGGGGTASINLRGFGAARTLVLMNGRRLAPNPQTAGFNLNFIPQAAVGRMEMLKEGAAVTYGSDAIGGVVNFLTRTDLDGLELDAEYSYIDGSDGDYQANVAWGSRFDNGNLLLTAGYRARSRMDIHERDWAVSRYEDPGYGGWTGASNPGFYNLNNATAATRAQFRDNGCAELGGQLTTASTMPTDSTAVTSQCRYQFSNFNDLVNDEDHYQLYGEINSTLSENVEMHTELAFARDQVHDQRLSPSNLSTQFPSAASAGGTSGSLATPGALNFFVPYNVPAYHPGLVELYSACAAPLTPAQCAAIAATPGGVDMSQTGFRTIAHAGHPTNPDGADYQNIQQDAFRFSTGLKGSVGDINWDTAVTYMRAQAEVNTNDLLVTRIQLALNGFGSLADGPECSTRNAAEAGRADLGCYFFNPFTNSVAVSAVNGQANPYYRGSANPAVTNNPQLVKWLYGNYTNETTNQIAVWDGVLSGELPFASLPGGNIGWAVGGQYRWDENREDYGDLFDSQTTPCVDSIDDGTPICGAPAGPLIFFGSNQDATYSRDVYAIFTEFNFPIFDSFSVNIAGRFEDYGSGIGSTTDPKLAVRWQALDWLALRGSVGTTFRAPGLSQTDPGCRTGVSNINGQYRGVETCGNPDLKPETADTFNAGVLISAGGFTGSIDYFQFKFDGELTTESSSRLFASMFPTGLAVTDPSHPCQAIPALRARFSFAGGECSANNVLRINVLDVNGPSTETSGLDLRMQYDWPMLFGGEAAVGLEATYLLEFKRGAFTLNGSPGVIFAAPEDRAGKHDLVSQFFSYPQTRANFFLSYAISDVTFRLQTRFTEGTEGAFGTPLQEWVPDAAAVGGWSRRDIGKTDDYIQHDLIVRAQLPWDTVLTGSIQNVLDEDPSDAPSQYNYDYTNGNPLGRVFEVNVKKRF
jgi:iron complex outermembrane recepter protein